MSEFDRFVAQVFDLIETHQGSALETAQAVRKLTQHALARPAFLAGCAERIIASMEASRTPWRNPPLWQSAEPPLQLRVFYWPPGQTSDPHLHGQWTVTGVLQNEVLVETFDSETDAEANRAAKKFSARVGEVGYLMPPCIHRVSNPSSGLSATLHVFSETATEGRRRVEFPMQAMLASPQTSPTVQRALFFVLRMLAAIHDPSVNDLLVRAFALAGPGLKLQIVRALVPRDAAVAYSLSEQLERSLSGVDRDKLSSINRELARACNLGGVAGAAAAAAGAA